MLKKRLSLVTPFDNQAGVDDTTTCKRLFYRDAVIQRNLCHWEHHLIITPDYLIPPYTNSRSVGMLFWEEVSLMAPQLFGSTGVADTTTCELLFHGGAVIQRSFSDWQHRSGIALEFAVPAHTNAHPSEMLSVQEASLTGTKMFRRYWSR